jgi:hypothetical protein
MSEFYLRGKGTKIGIKSSSQIGISSFIKLYKFKTIINLNYTNLW